MRRVIKTGWSRRLLELVFRWFSPEVRIPITKGIFQAFIEHLSAHLQRQMGTLLRPLHLLIFGGLDLDKSAMVKTNGEVSVNDNSLPE
jgi:hypothetical protein